MFLDKKYIFSFILGIFSLSCIKDKDSSGLEYMPDMYRSPAIEAYVDYGIIQGKEVAVLKTQMSARTPVKGTIVFQADTNKIKYNFPLEYASPTEDPAAYELAKTKLKNPIPYSTQVEEEGKILYNRFCASCHGMTGKGDGKVVEWGNFPTPGAYDTKHKDATEGQMFYSITYGKGLMGPHASLVNKEDRWKIVHYVQTLQGKKR